jgi:hypothetical protein
MWSKIKAFFSGIVDFFKDEKGRFSSGRLTKILSVILAAIIGYCALFTSAIAADKMPYVWQVELGLLAYAGITQVSQNATGQ